MPSLADIHRIALALPGAEERMMTGGLAWFIRKKPFAWECHPWPSTPPEIREIVASELVVGVKVADPLDAQALREMEPNVFLPPTTRWGEPKVAFRMALVDGVHLEELVIESWRVLAPKFLVREFDSR
jgi:hypothetical protein